MGFSTRAMMAGLLGFGLVTALPMTAEARGDARQTVQTQRSAAPAARPTATRTQAQPARRDAAPARNASVRPTGQQASRQQANLPSRRAAADTRNMSARQRANAAVPYANSRQAAANPRSLRQSAMMTCTTRNGRRTCTPEVRNTSFRWTGGLAPAAMSQSACPDGTIATNAIGHSNVVRCVPL